MTAVIANLHFIAWTSEHTSASACRSGLPAARGSFAAAQVSNRNSRSAVCDGSSRCLSLAIFCLISHEQAHIGIGLSPRYVRGDEFF